MMRLRSVILLASLLMPVAVMAQSAGGGAAGAGGNTTGSASTPNPSNAMQPPQVVAMLEAQGFTEVSNIRRIGNTYQAQAMQNGRPVFVTVDPTTGKVVPR